jgi:glycosyltransferase involved in cell wall biosynthesis
MVLGPEPRISVVIPVRNGARYLGEAIDSLLAQQPPVHEVLVVDDGSDDASAGIAEGYGDPVRCLRRPACGPGAARNAGIAASRGELIGFLDADDRWGSDALRGRMAVLCADPTLELAFGHVRQFIDPDVDPQTRNRLPASPDAEPRYLLGTMLARRGTLDRIGPFREDLQAGDFIDWIVRAREAGVRSGFVPDLVLWRRAHGENLSHRRATLARDYARVVKASLDRRRTANR